MSDDSQTKRGNGEESDVKIEDTEEEQTTQQSDKYSMENKRKRTNKFAEDDEIEIQASEVESVVSDVKEKKKRGGGRKIARNEDKPQTNKRRK